MDIQQDSDEQFGGIERLEARFTNLRLSQEGEGPISLTVAQQPDLEAHTYRFSTTAGEIFAVHSTIPLGLGHVVVNLRSEKGTTTFDLACTAGVIEVERSSQHMFRLTTKRPDDRPDHEDHWEAVIHIEGGAEPLLLELQASQQERVEGLTTVPSSHDHADP